MVDFFTLMKNKFNHYHFIILYTVLNIFQIWGTELTSDEGYYWFYSLKLDWGYYDHPPLFAVTIWLGGLLFESELGVRLFNVLLMSIGLLFLFKLIPEKEKKYAYLIILSIPLLNYITFITFPDTPLVAISAIALFAYKKFLDKSDLKSSLVLGLLFGLMLYAKYHAVLFVFFIILSNLKLLKNKYFYLAIIFASLLFVPHLWWQYENNFPSFYYHLLGRASQFEINYLIDYVLQQIVIIGIGVIFVPFVFKPKNQFEKTLKYIIVGTLIFFSFSTSRGFVHIHWTSIILFPIIILATKYYSSKTNNRLLKSIVLPFVVILLIARLFLIFNILNINHLGVDYYHDRDLWAEDIKLIAGENPVIFETGNSGLREAPLYTFYSKRLAVAMFPGEHKKSQYQIRNYEDSVQSKTVIYIKSDQYPGYNKLITRMGKPIYYKEIKNFVSFNNIQIECNNGKVLVEEDSIRISIKIFNHRNSPINFTNDHQLYIRLENKEGESTIRSRPISGIQQINSNKEKEYDFIFGSDNLLEGEYYFTIGFDNSITGQSVNSNRSKLLITKQ